MIYAKNNARTTAIVITISVSSLLLALGPLTFGSQAAQAQANPTLGLISGEGSGQIVCPNGQSSFGLIGFNGAEQSNGQWSEDWSITLGGPSVKSGVITDGHVTPSRYSLQGTETFDTLCVGSGGGIPTTVTIKGKCDDNVKIEFSAANGERGTFVGEVHCIRASN